MAEGFKSEAELLALKESLGFAPVRSRPSLQEVKKDLGFLDPVEQKLQDWSRSYKTSLAPPPPPLIRPFSRGMLIRLFPSQEWMLRLRTLRLQSRRRIWRC